MSRPQSIIYSNAYYHVMDRGAGHREIFNDKEERSIFLQALEESCYQFNIEVHAYCSMGCIHNDIID